MISIFIITVFLLIIAIGIIFLVLVYQKKQLQYIGEKKQLTATYEKEILESRLEIQEQTFKNISQEIHDNIGQVLSLVKLNINTMDCNMPDVLKNQINDSRVLLTKAIQDLRDLSKGLNTDYIDNLGLIKAIDYELEMIKKTGNYDVSFKVEGNIVRMQQQEELILFRIVQEVLHNITKHANATAINIIAKFEADLFTLTISDNGSGFNPEQLGENSYDDSGLGIRNMNNRAKLINAKFNLSSTLHKGTTVSLALLLPVKL